MSSDRNRYDKSAERKVDDRPGEKRARMEKIEDKLLKMEQNQEKTMNEMKKTIETLVESFGKAPK
jgi:hypothetical protein